MPPRMWGRAALAAVAGLLAFAALWWLPAVRRAERSEDALVQAVSDAQSSARRLDELVRGADAKGLKALESRAHGADEGERLEALARCVAVSPPCDEISTLSRSVKLALAASTDRARRSTEEARTRAWILAWLGMGWLASCLGLVAAALSASRQEERGSPAVEGAGPATLEDAYREQLERVYRVRRQKRENARFAAFGELAAGLSHGLKTPLAGVRASAQVIGAKLGDSEVQPQLDAIVDEVDTLVDEINRFLRSMGTTEPVFEDVDARQFMNSIAERYQSGDAQRGITWSLTVDDHISTFHLAPELVEMALRNLIDNAMQASVASSTVEVRVAPCEAPARVGLDAEPPSEASKQGSWVEIAVLDRGPGIPSTVLEREVVVSSRPEGSGLGLSIARRIAARHGGVLRLRPRDDGAGTRASFILPLTNGRARTDEGDS